MDTRESVLSLTERNGIAEEDLMRELYRTLLWGLFESICKDMKKNGTTLAERARFVKFRDKTVPTKQIVRKYAGCTLPDEAYAEMATLLTAHFGTGDPRVAYGEDLRRTLLSAQGNRCAICRAEIAADSAHLDHIVPFEYVGDRLAGNYQMLCPVCNERKGSASAFALSALLLNRENAEKN